MKKYWFENDFILILAVFICWNLFLSIISFFSVFLIPVYGGWFPYVEEVLKITRLPFWIWGWGSFDGVHYLRIAQNGYTSFSSQAFFPLYPLLIRFFNIFPKIAGLDTRIYVDPSFFLTGFLISKVASFFVLYFFYKLVSGEFGKKVAYISLIFLLSWPTAFYFSAIYTESLFLLLVIIAVYFSERKKYFWSGLSAALASATRVVGVLLFLLLLIEFFRNYKGKCSLSFRLMKDVVGIFISPLGFILYAIYLWINFGNPFYFIEAQPFFGAERSSLPLILFPQILYRYFKIFINIPLFSHSFFIASLELAMTLVSFFLLFSLFGKIRFSYWLFTFLALIIPTLTGTLSSMPRYTLVSFLIFPFVVKKYPKVVITVIPFLILVQVVLISNFIRGYWVS